jgi:tripartite-type tricarboxylate transporter receptor subunit TctC
VKAAPDGYTLLEVTTSNTVNAALYDNLSFNFIHDIAPVAGIVRGTGVMEVNPLVPAKTIPEFITYAKANPGQINMATSGVGSAPHIYGELFKKMAGLNMVPVAYRGSGPALIDLIGGQVQVMFSDLSSSLEHIKAGKIRPLGVTTSTRSDALPNVPTISESVPNYEASAWGGLGAPRGTPADIIETLNREINAALADASLKARFADLGATVLPGSPADFSKLIAGDTEKWGQVIRTANIKPE